MDLRYKDVICYQVLVEDSIKAGTVEPKNSHEQLHLHCNERKAKTVDLPRLLSRLQAFS